MEHSAGRGSSLAPRVSDHDYHTLSMSVIRASGKVVSRSITVPPPQCSGRGQQFAGLLDIARPRSRQVPVEEGRRPRATLSARAWLGEGQDSPGVGVRRMMSKLGAAEASVSHGFPSDQYHSRGVAEDIRQAVWAGLPPAIRALLPPPKGPASKPRNVSTRDRDGGCRSCCKTTSWRGHPGPESLEFFGLDFNRRSCRWFRASQKYYVLIEVSL